MVLELKKELFPSIFSSSLSEPTFPYNVYSICANVIVIGDKPIIANKTRLFILTNVAATIVMHTPYYSPLSIC